MSSPLVEKHGNPYPKNHIEILAICRRSDPDRWNMRDGVQCSGESILISMRLPSPYAENIY